ncbi:CopG family ribbon-helix-helix protein [Bosea sp. R86505]|uniref:CopG family ribbon-helix-helix protein n=1 Tax=Bosea sp. R86505 TaxID=3101710 RepID=UPI00366A5831
MSSPDLFEPISLRLPSSILSEIETIAAASERTRSWVIVRALKRYLATEGAEILAATEGRGALAAGEGHDLDDVIGEIERIIRSGKAA